MFRGVNHFKPLVGWGRGGEDWVILSVLDIFPSPMPPSRSVIKWSLLKENENVRDRERNRCWYTQDLPKI